MIDYYELKNNLCLFFKLDFNQPLSRVLAQLRQSEYSMREIAQGAMGEASESSIRRLLRRFKIK
jgi:hypothetical protein